MSRIMSSAVWIALGLGLIAGPSDAQELTKSDRQGPVTVTVTWSAPLAVGMPLQAKVVLDTHSVGLDAIALNEVVTLRGPDGVEAAPTAVDTKGSGHHREATLTFGPITKPGRVEIVVRNVGGVAERIFAWEAR